MSNRKLLRLQTPAILTFVFAVTMLAFPAYAQSLITSLGGLNYNDEIDWGALGGEDTLLNSGFTINSIGLSETATTSNTGNFSIRVGEVGWNYAFGYGVNLLYDQGIGPVTIVFSTPVNSVGFNIDNNFYGYFDATIQAFGAQNNSLGGVTETLHASYVENSVGFIGIGAQGINSIVISTSGSRDIPIVIGTDSLGANDFAVGPIYLATVPEPTTLALLGLSFVALLFYRPRLFARVS